MGKTRSRLGEIKANRCGFGSDAQAIDGIARGCRRLRKWRAAWRMSSISRSGAIATFSQAGQRMLNRPEPMVSRALDVFRQINQEALAAGEGIQRIRRLFEQEVPNRTRCQLPELIAELRPVLDAIGRCSKGSVRVEVSQPIPDLVIDRAANSACAVCIDSECRRSQRPSDGSRLRFGSMLSSDRYTVETGVTDSGPGVPAELQDQAVPAVLHHQAAGHGSWPGVEPCHH